MLTLASIIYDMSARIALSFSDRSVAEIRGNMFSWSAVRSEH